MLEFQCASDVKVAGAVIMAFAAGFPNGQRPHLMEILEESGIDLDTLRPDSFYSYKNYLDALKLIRERLGGPIISKIADATLQTIPLPPNWTEIQVFLENIDAGYQSQFAGQGDRGGYEYQGVEKQNGLHRARLVAKHPLPCEYERGTLEGLAKRFPAKGGEEILIRHDDDAPCKKKGGASCSWIITWG
jgi:hypothetical protein